MKANKYARIRFLDITTIAVAHAQLIALYWVLRNGVPYQQQRQQLEQQEREFLIRHHLHRLAQLGYTA